MCESLPNEIELKCVFCQSTSFEVPHKDYIPKDGELVKCANCKQLNDVTSMRKVIMEDVEKETVKDLESHIKKLFKK